ncbi:MAG TPA: DNA cytosine methyltransferase, partial [Gemmataceae bacterium]
MESKKRKRPSRPIAIDLFCGAGGMSVGFERAGFDIALGVDRDGHHAATHERNFPNGKTLCRSVGDLTAAEAIEALDGRNEVDLIVGGPPCQGFSTMGQRDALDPRNTLVAEFVRLVRDVRPKAFVMENVPGMLAGSTHTILADALSQF